MVRIGYWVDIGDVLRGDDIFICLVGVGDTRHI
jgi:hypothetical protein